MIEDKDDDDLWTCHWCGEEYPRSELRDCGYGGYERVCAACWESRHDCPACKGSGGGVYEWKCPYCHGSGTDRASVEREREG